MLDKDDFEDDPIVLTDIKVADICKTPERNHPQGGLDSYRTSEPMTFVYMRIGKFDFGNTSPGHTVDSRITRKRHLKILDDENLVAAVEAWKPYLRLYRHLDKRQNVSQRESLYIARCRRLLRICYSCNVLQRFP